MCTRLRGQVISDGRRVAEDGDLKPFEACA